MQKLSLTFLMISFIAILMFNCKGDDGDVGPAGVPGAPGAPGTDGVDGVDGTDGINGTNGTNGDPGPAGPAGETPELAAMNGTLTGTISGLRSDDVEFSEPFEINYDYEKNGWEVDGVDHTVWIERTKKPFDWESFIYFRLRTPNKGANDMTISLSEGRIQVVTVYQDNNAFKVTSDFSTNNVTNVMYDAATGDLSLHFEVETTNSFTLKPLFIQCDLSMKVYNSMIRSTEEDNAGEIQLK